MSSFQRHCTSPMPVVWFTDPPIVATACVPNFTNKHCLAVAYMNIALLLHMTEDALLSKLSADLWDAMSSMFKMVLKAERQLTREGVHRCSLLQEHCFRQDLEQWLMMKWCVVQQRDKGVIWRNPILKSTIWLMYHVMVKMYSMMLMMHQMANIPWHDSTMMTGTNNNCWSFPNSVSCQTWMLCNCCWSCW